MRITVRAQSMAALPPPMMTTRWPSRTASPRPRPPGNAARRRRRSARCRAHARRFPSRCRATGRPRRISLQVAQRDVRADAGVQHEVHPEATDDLDLAVEHLAAAAGTPAARSAACRRLRRASRRRRPRARAARGRRRRSVRPGRRRRRRPLAGRGLPLARTTRSAIASNLSDSRMLVGDDAVDLAHVDRLVDGLAAAAVVAGMLADAARWRPAADCRG